LYSHLHPHDESPCRKLLGDSWQESQYIATIPGVGYRFVAEVRKTEDGFTQRRKEEDAKNAKEDPAPLRPFRYALLIIVPLVLVAIAYAWYTKEKPRPAMSSIMVLPVENLSGDPAEEYFADGMTDALIGDLAQIGGLHVISRTSSMHYKGTKKSRAYEERSNYVAYFEVFPILDPIRSDRRFAELIGRVGL
jgi:hypothetical protein